MIRSKVCPNLWVGWFRCWCKPKHSSMSKKLIALWSERSSTWILKSPVIIIGSEHKIIDSKRSENSLINSLIKTGVIYIIRWSISYIKTQLFGRPFTQNIQTRIFSPPTILWIFKFSLKKGSAASSSTLTSLEPQFISYRSSQGSISSVIIRKPCRSLLLQRGQPCCHKQNPQNWQIYFEEIVHSKYTCGAHYRMNSLLQWNLNEVVKVNWSSAPNGLVSWNSHR